jgi:RNA recognition motif-containing protein
MSTKLYVGNLSWRVSSDDLFEHFGQAGTVESANVVMDRETGRSRGFGFVEMGSSDAAAAASMKLVRVKRAAVADAAVTAAAEIAAAVEIAAVTTEIKEIVGKKTVKSE